jgi:acetyl esterase
MEPLAPGMRRISSILRRTPGSNVAKLTREQVERMSGAGAPEFFASILQGVRPRGLTVEDRTVGRVPIRIYRPKRATMAPRPLVVYFHGGGFAFGDLRGGDWIAGTVAHDLNAIVV